MPNVGRPFALSKARGDATLQKMNPFGILCIGRKKGEPVWRPGQFERLGGHGVKRLYDILRIALGCFVGVYIGLSLYRYFDYQAHPDLYLVQSTPWYTRILVQGLFTVLIVLALAVAMRLVKRKIG